MKLLYIAPVIIDPEKLNGVSKKIFNQIEIFKNYYFVELISYGPDCLFHFHDNKIDKIELGNLNRRLKLYSFIKSDLIHNNYNNVFIRYHLSDFLFINLLKSLKKKKSKIIIEIPTYPYKKELLNWDNGKIRYLVDLSSRVFLNFYVERIVTYSNDKLIFGIQTINTINGIIFKNVKPIKTKIRLENEINLISVSISMNCHGYDRLIEGLNNYYKNSGVVKVFYHLVGDGIELKRYQLLIDKYKLHQYVMLYGFKGGHDLDEIYDKSDIAINSLAIHRIRLKSESTIKSKEYAAKGLPMVSSYDIDAFSSAENKKFVLKISADDSPVDIYEIINFHKKVYNENKDLSKKIRIASQNRSDMQITLKDVLDYFNNFE